MKVLTRVYVEPWMLGGADAETLRKFARSGARLNVLDANELGGPFSPSWFDPVAQILRNSRQSLNRLDFCASELMKFIRLYGYSLSTLNGSCFPNLTVLHIYMPDVADVRTHRSLLRRLSIGANFPKLQKLSVYFGGCEHELRGEEYEQDYEQCPPSDLRISSLRIGAEWCYEEVLEYFFSTFSLLTSLRIYLDIFFDDAEHAYSLSQVFSSFKHLRKLRLIFNCHGNDDVPNFSLDAIFCGINFEEAEKLRLECQENEVALATMEIVPVRPGLTSACSKDFLCNLR